jgi:signal transduction histidine kinase
MVGNIITDITGRKRAEAEREELIAKLEAQNAELERFTYTVSHDLKSPLITINGYVGMLREDLAEGDSEQVASDLGRISNAAGKMDHLLRDVLELSRIGRLVSALEEVSLKELAQEAIEIVGGQARERGVQIEISPDLPVVFGDRLRLLEVLQNLIDNAVKYMGDQAEPRVEIGWRRDGNETICYLCDNGIGIEPRYHDTIFGLFDQLDQKVEGSGIGLSLVKRVVEVHGGRVWVESEGPGRGSTFFFTIAARSESPQRQGTERCTASH